MGSFRGAACLALAVLVFSSMVVCGSAQLNKSLLSYSPNRTNFSANGQEVSLTMRNESQPYAAAGSRNAYLYGSLGAWMKLVPNDSAGTVTTLYLSSSGPRHCEFDFEFLGNSSGEPYILHTNIFVEGVGGREMQFRLWFDPTLDYHYYNFQWNKDLVVFFVDNYPIRRYGNFEYKNNATAGNSTTAPGNATAPPLKPWMANITTFQYPKDCPMNLYLSIWDGSSWATQGGRVKLNWLHAPFTALYRRFSLNGCVANPDDPASIKNCQTSPFASKVCRVDGNRRSMMAWVKNNYIHYSYCTDKARYSSPPIECAGNGDIPNPKTGKY